MDEENMQQGAEYDQAPAYEPEYCENCVALRETIRELENSKYEITRENRDLRKNMSRMQDILDMLYGLVSDGKNLSIRLKCLADKMARNI